MVAQNSCFVHIKYIEHTSFCPSMANRFAISCHQQLVTSFHIGSVHLSESSTIAAFHGEKGENQLNEKGNVFNTFNMHARYFLYFFPFSSIITLIDPNKISGSRSDTSAAGFELKDGSCLSKEIIAYTSVIRHQCLMSAPM